MNIQILGTRGEIKASAPYHSKHSGLLIDNTLLFDLGEKEFLKYKPKIIFLTHLHPDHAFFINNNIEVNIPIYAPEKTKNTKKIRREIKYKEYKIKPIPTHHSKKVKSQSYLIQKKDNKILYTGDMIWINKEHHKLLKNIDLIITEASFFRKGGMIRRDKKTKEIYGHNGMPDLVNLFKKFTNNILFIHFGSWFYKNTQESRKKIKQLGKENNVNTYIGYDNLKINLNKLK
ncbi:MAG: hypothetical protein GF387_01095 [Candidatus Portnoybacteria bacterium]|nr:hypothetical protein [Candidatus Portnoybacteria bacterium]